MDAVLNFLRDLFANISTGAVLGYNSFLTSLSLDMIIKGIIVYLLIIWAAFIIWVIKDISNRTTSLILQTVAIMLIIGLTPVFGLPIYLLIRPRTTLFERYYTEGSAGDESTQEVLVCYKCGESIDGDFFYCPACRERLLAPCASCSKMNRTQWHVCPYCGANHPEESEKAKKGIFGNSKKSKKPEKTEPKEAPKVVEHSDKPSEITPENTILPEDEASQAAIADGTVTVAEFHDETTKKPAEETKVSE